MPGTPVESEWSEFVQRPFYPQTQEGCEAAKEVASFETYEVITAGSAGNIGQMSVSPEKGMRGTSAATVNGGRVRKSRSSGSSTT